MSEAIEKCGAVSPSIGDTCQRAKGHDGWHSDIPDNPRDLLSDSALELVDSISRIPPAPPTKTGEIKLPVRYDEQWGRIEDASRSIIATIHIPVPGRVSRAERGQAIADALNTRTAEREPCNLCDTLRSEAEIHAQEARTANATINEIYQLVTGATGEPGNWNGAEPVRQMIEQRNAEREALIELHGAVKHYFKWKWEKLDARTRKALAQAERVLEGK